MIFKGFNNYFCSINLAKLPMLERMNIKVTENLEQPEVAKDQSSPVKSTVQQQTNNLCFSPRNKVIQEKLVKQQLRKFIKQSEDSQSFASNGSDRNDTNANVRNYKLMVQEDGTTVINLQSPGNLGETDHEAMTGFIIVII